MGVATASSTAFCTRCGRSLADGPCPDHRVSLERPRGVRGFQARSSIALVAAALSLLLAVGMFAQVRTTSRRERRLSRELAASTAAVKGLANRLGAIEARTGAELDVGAVAKKVEPSVFTIEDSEGGVGSGFALRFSAPNTEVVTNFHVVERDWKKGRKDLKLRQPGRELTGHVVNVNPATDLAIIHVDEMLPVLQRAPGNPAVGDPVIVVGSPLRLENTVSTGIVSALRDEFLQFSAPVSPGNSGGPVVDRSGRVIGVARAKEAGGGAEGLSFAIPIAVVCASLSIC